MTVRITASRRFALNTAVIVLVLFAVRIPATQSAIIAGLVEFADIAERVVRFPCWLLDHSRCFSLDRLDPTCPQCM